MPEFIFNFYFCTSYRKKEGSTVKTTENFTDRADIYAKYRPSYPNEYIDYLLSANQLKGNQIVADIGSGTGIFSHQLLESGLHVIGVEPNDDMRKMAEQSLKLYSRFQSIKATAENTTLKENSVDLVTVAQAFHWFDKEAFKIECQRILKQKANVALVWNSRDLTSPLIKENAEICQKTCPNFKGFSGGIDETPEVFNNFLKMESMILKNIKMIYFLIMKGFWEGIYQHLMLRKKMTNSIKLYFSPIRAIRKIQ